MEANFQPSPRMKRKDFEDVDDDVSDFIFSSPATKIRRLDAELPPMVIVEEEPESAAAAFDQSQRLPEQNCNESGGLKIEELPNLGENEERAIVLFQPSITPTIMRSPSNFSVSLDPRFMSGWKNQVLRSSQANSWRLASDEAATEDDISSSGNGCQAVVPWFPPRFSSADGSADNSLSADNSSYQYDGSEMMDAEEMGEATMDVEEDSSSIQQRNAGLPQWQHCTILLPPQNTTTPIVWYP